jgi:hypothetical protein
MLVLPTEAVLLLNAASLLLLRLPCRALSCPKSPNFGSLRLPECRTPFCHPAEAWPPGFRINSCPTSRRLRTASSGAMACSVTAGSIFHAAFPFRVLGGFLGCSECQRLKCPHQISSTCLVVPLRLITSRPLLLVFTYRLFATGTIGSDVTDSRCGEACLYHCDARRLHPAKRRLTSFPSRGPFLNHRPCIKRIIESFVCPHTPNATRGCASLGLVNDLSV